MENLILIIDIGTSFLKGLSFLPKNTGPKTLDFFKIRSNPQHLEDFKGKLKILLSFFLKRLSLKDTKVIFLSGEGVGFGNIARMRFEREDPFLPIKKREFSLMAKILQKRSLRETQLKAKTEDLILVFAEIEKVEIDDWETAWPLGARGGSVFLQIVNFYLPLPLYLAIRKILTLWEIKDFSFYYFPCLFSHLFSGKERPIARIFLDVGGTNTQIFKVHSGILEYVSEIPYGGDHFTKKIIEKMGLEGEKQTQEEFIEEIKKKLSQRILAPYLQKKIEKILALGYNEWREMIIEKLKGELFEKEVYLLGGGSTLPVFFKRKNFLEKEKRPAIIEVVRPKAIPVKIGGETEFAVQDSQFINPLLLAKVISQGKALILKPLFYDLPLDLLY